MLGECLKGYFFGIVIGEKGFWDIFFVDVENFVKKEFSCIISSLIIIFVLLKV